LAREKFSNLTYLITARHAVRNSGFDGPFYVRFNGPEGAIVWRYEDPDWVFHDDPTVDVAVLEIAMPPGADVHRLTKNNLIFLTEERLAKGDIGPGDQTYAVGLFSYLPGKSKNIPLVHVGHIAAFPDDDERVPVQDWRDPSETVGVNAYVVQCDVMPGVSGAPVFVRKPVTAAGMEHRHEAGGVVQDKLPKPPLGYGAVFLLGLWKGAWELDKKRMVAGATVRDPAGFGIVVPSYQILEVLNMPKLIAGQVAARKRAKAVPVPTDDALPKKDAKAKLDTTLRRMLDTPPAKKAVTRK